MPPLIYGIAFVGFVVFLPTGKVFFASNRFQIQCWLVFQELAPRKSIINALELMAATGVYESLPDVFFQVSLSITSVIAELPTGWQRAVTLVSLIQR